jgi:hypothetical protein
MNILEKFTDIYKQCIIILSGFEKLHLREYAIQLAKDFNFELIEFKYPDFESLNKLIKDSKSKNIIIYGLTFPANKLEFKANYHLSLSGNKTLIDDESQYSLFTQYVKENFINKFKNIKVSEFNDEISEDIFNTCIQYIMKKVYGDNYDKAQEKYKKDSESSSSSSSSSKSSSDSSSDSSSSSSSSSSSNSSSSSDSSSSSKSSSKSDSESTIFQELDSAESNEMKKETIDWIIEKLFVVFMVAAMVWITFFSYPNS